MLVEGGESPVASARVRTDVSVAPERAMAMLALTALHDVMKVEALLP